MHLIAQGLGGLLHVLLGLICLGFLAVMALLVTVASLLMKKSRDVPSEPRQYPHPDNAPTTSNGPSFDGDRPRKEIYKVLAVAVYALVGAITGGVLIWPVVIFGSFGAVLFAKPVEVLIITAFGAVVGAILGAVVGVALARSAGRKPPNSPRL